MIIVLRKHFLPWHWNPCFPKPLKQNKILITTITNIDSNTFPCTPIFINLKLKISLKIIKFSTLNQYNNKIYSEAV